MVFGYNLRGLLGDLVIGLTSVLKVIDFPTLSSLENVNRQARSGIQLRVESDQFDDAVYAITIYPDTEPAYYATLSGSVSVYFSLLTSPPVPVEIPAEQLNLLHNESLEWSTNITNFNHFIKRKQYDKLLQILPMLRAKIETLEKMALDEPLLRRDYDHGLKHDHCRTEEALNEDFKDLDACYHRFLPSIHKMKRMRQLAKDSGETLLAHFSELNQIAYPTLGLLPARDKVLFRVRAAIDRNARVVEKSLETSVRVEEWWDHITHAIAMLKRRRHHHQRLKANPDITDIMINHPIFRLPGADGSLPKTGCDWNCVPCFAVSTGYPTPLKGCICRKKSCDHGLKN
ncbi:hypothetical protein ABW21_db0203446 [Orbilia brochopaga]|nr:hypothetical protein ABW21_db0203446 [Drechslerella brochopaga]